MLYRGVVELHGRLVDFLQQLKDGAYIQCSISSLMLVCSCSIPYHLMHNFLQVGCGWKREAPLTTAWPSQSGCG